MTKEQAVKFFGSQKKLADALSAAGYALTQPTVAGWKAVPLDRQLQIELLTAGVLKADSPELRAVVKRRVAA